MGNLKNLFDELNNRNPLIGDIRGPKPEALRSSPDHEFLELKTSRPKSEVLNPLVFNNSEYCRFTENGTYPAKKGGCIVALSPKELLEVGRNYPSREQIMIAYFGELPTRVLYFGEDANSMRKTLDDLRLPNSWPSNLGEKVFYLFKGHLGGITGSVSLEQQVISGKEHQFGLVLKKLIDIYRASEQTRFHAAENATLSGEILS